MKKQGWDVHIITNRYPRSLPAHGYLDGIKVTRYFFFHSPLNYISNRRVDLFFAWLVLKPVTLFKLFSLFKQTKPDLINLHFPDHQLFECYLLELLFRFKLIISLHGNEVERMGTLKKKTLRRYFYNKLFKSAVFITGCSQYLLNEFQEIFPQKDSEKCLTIHNGVGEHYLTQYLTAKKKDHIFTAARFVPKKGLDLLLDAFQQDNDIALLIAGGNRSDLDKLGFEIIKGIYVLGELTPADMAKHLATNKITVIPSIIEPYGIIVAEAICCGSPVVATNVGGIPEVIALAKKNLNSGEQKVFNMLVKLVEPDTGSIRAGMNEIMENYSGLEEYIKLVPKVRKQFSWSKRLDRYHNMLAES